MTVEAETIMAIRRDAGWWPNPNTRHPKRWHVLLNKFNPACGTQMMPDYCGAIEAAGVPVSSRCQRSGCKALWLLADDKAKAGFAAEPNC